MQSAHVQIKGKELHLFFLHLTFLVLPLTSNNLKQGHSVNILMSKYEYNTLLISSDSSPVHRLAVSSDFHWLACVDCNNTLNIFSLNELKVLSFLIHLVVLSMLWHQFDMWFKERPLTFEVGVVEIGLGKSFTPQVELICIGNRMHGDLHYEWYLEILSKLHEPLGDCKLKEFYNINCTSFHTLTHLLCDWENGEWACFYLHCSANNLISCLCF